MPRKSLHGRTCGVSRAGRRARALQQNRRSSALLPTHPHPESRIPNPLKAPPRSPASPGSTHRC
ncbi:hypothetical protein XarjCFBP7645_06790 [Xanthomonas arboricola]|uniref:Uncharacterized protein n=1 Tax=Xanthomonas arboricola TaxID=56448 RepID=A0A2S7AJ62_9XANT|nr:hypothetical protein XarjCFBP7645_06790 [Xanthomonas arboricola]